jgi:ABC-2 type transport system ATP-binding protein
MLSVAQPATVVAQAGAPGPTPGPCGSNFTKTSQFVTVMDGPTNTNAVQIDTDLYVPTAASSTNPQPVVIYANGFGGAKDDASGTAIGNWLASHCYIVLAYSSSGFGKSGGCIQLDSPQYDVKDVKALIDWLALRTDVLKDTNGPIIGMAGGSYGGGIQLMSAEFDARIRAITPFRTWNTLNYALSPQHLGNGSLLYDATQPPGVAKYDWTTLFFLSGSTGMNQCPPVNPPVMVGTVPCAGFPASVCNSYGDTAANGFPSATTQALLANSSPLSYLTAGPDPTGASGRIGLKIPTLLGQGQSDTLFNINEAVATYRFLRNQGTPTRLVWHQGGHGYTDQPGEGDLFDSDQADPDQKYLPQQMLLWFERYLRGITTVDTGAQFSYFQDWVPYTYTNDPAVLPFASAPDFPVGSTQSYFLSAASDLVPTSGTPTAGTVTIVNPPNSGIAAAPLTGYPQPGVSFTECSNFQQPGSTLPGGIPNLCPPLQPSDPTGTFAAFTTPPLCSDAASVGIPTAHLHLSNVNAANTGLMLFGKVYDVAPGGSTQLVHRLIAPFRAPNGGGTVDVYLDGIAHLFPVGHSIRFELAATDSTSINNKLADTITITTGGADPSTFTLPLAPLSCAVVPEAPYPLLLPLTAVVVGAAAYLWIRRRKNGTSA